MNMAHSIYIALNGFHAVYTYNFGHLKAKSGRATKDEGNSRFFIFFFNSSKYKWHAGETFANMKEIPEKEEEEIKIVHFMTIEVESGHH